jgi:hypothetical protein
LCCPADDPQNLKALYRRGQAYAALQQHAQAEQDLQVSLELSDHDPQQQQLIREKLKTVREKLAAEQQQDEASGSGAAAGAEAAAVAAAGQEEDGLIEEVKEDTDDEVPELEEDLPELGVIGEPAKQQQQQPSSRSAAQRQAAAAGGSSSSSAGGAAGGGSGGSDLAEMQARAAEMMRANPDLARQVRPLLGIEAAAAAARMAATARHCTHSMP